MDQIRWLGPYKPTDRHADDVTLSDLLRLRAENHKLKQAFQIVWTRGGLDMDTVNLVLDVFETGVPDGLELQNR